MAQDPQKGEGWDFEDNQTWLEALQTEENQPVVDIDAYDEYANIQELVNFVQGQGSYSHTRSFTPGEQDLEMKKREMHNDQWKIPEKLEQISEYLENEDQLAPNAIDLDPDAETQIKITQDQDPHKNGAETRYTMHFIAYNPDEQIDDGEEPSAQFYLQGSWYDTPPEEMNLEQIFDSLYEPEKHEK